MKQALLAALLLPLLLMPSGKLMALNDDVEISGLVIDRTLTRFGKEFSFHYSSYFRELPFTQGFNVTLIETVFPQAGTLLVLEINGTKIYSTHFGRRASSIEDKAKEAVLITVDYLAAVRASAITGDELQPIGGTQE